jgi:hypothetical protein
MNAPLAELERIVCEVLAEMGLASATGGASAGDCPDFGKATVPFSPGENRDSPPAKMGLSPLVPASQPAADEIVVHARVVTMAEVAERLTGVRRVVVSPRAVVTPAVRDELRRRQVALVHAAPGEPRAASLPRLVVMAVPARCEPAAVLQSLGREGVQVERHTVECLIAGTDQLAGEITKSNKLAVLYTCYAAAALCLANRYPGVRAVAAGDTAAAAAAVAAVGANLLVLDPDASSEFQQKQILGEFCRGGIRPCPDVFQKRLG